MASLHANMPQYHPNGFFSTESHYLMVTAESITRLREFGGSEANDQYMKQPKLNFEVGCSEANDQFMKQQKLNFEVGCSEANDQYMKQPKLNFEVGCSEANDQYMKQPKLNFFNNQNIKVNAVTTTQNQATNATDNFFDSKFDFGSSTIRLSEE